MAARTTIRGLVVLALLTAEAPRDAGAASPLPLPAPPDVRTAGTAPTCDGELPLQLALGAIATAP